jgi:hypothetical protein
MEQRLPAWREAAERLDAALQPIANRPIALSEMSSLADRYRELDPLGQAGVREAAATLMDEILEAYPRASCADRIEMRALFEQHRALGWAAGFLLPLAPDARTLRQQLLLFSLLDQGTDSRDALLWLRALCAQPGVDCSALPDLLRDIAALSSAIDRYHMGSTASMLAAVASELQVSSPPLFPPPSDHPTRPAASRRH